MTNSKLVSCACRMTATLVVYFLLHPGLNGQTDQSHAAQGSPKTDLTSISKKVSVFSKVAKELRKTTGTPGAAIVVIHNGKQVYKECLGFRDLGKKHSVDEETLFAIGSCSKAMTAAVAAQLVDEGVITWNTTARSIVPEFQMSDDYASENVTLKDMFTHHTGLARHNVLWYGSSFRRDQLIEKLPHLQAGSGFRERYDYNNIMFSIGGELLGIASEKSWDELIREKIFEPLGMKQSHTRYLEFMEDENRSTGYQPDGTTVVPHLNIDVVGPAGSVTSTLKDMTLWLTMLVNQGQNERHEADISVLNKQNFEFLTSPHVVVVPTRSVFYGLGWDVHWRKGKKSVGHGGGIDGQNCFVKLIPESGFGIVVLANQQSDFDDLLVEYAADIFVHESFAGDHAKEAAMAQRRIENQKQFAAAKLPSGSSESKSSEPSGDLAQYAGSYQHPAYGEILISPQSSRNLEVKFNKFKGSLTPSAVENTEVHAVNLVDLGEFEFKFEKESNIVTQLRVKFEPSVSELVFEKPSGKAQLIDRYINELMAQYKIPGAAVAVVRNDELMHRQFYGMSDVENQTSVNKDTLFGVFSLTKLFVSTAVMKLVEEKKFTLETPIGQLLSDLPEPWQMIRVKHLLSHSSGLPEIKDYSPHKESEAKQKVYGDEIKFFAGEKYDYNQTNFWLLHRIIRQTTNQSFADFMWETQFGTQRPSIAFGADLSKKITNRSESYFPFTDDIPPQKFDYLDASNGLNLTLDEFLKWNEKLDSGELISDESRDLMWEKFSYVQPTNFAHGWQIHSKGQTSYGFSGSLVTAFRKFPESELTIILLGNGFEEFFDIEIAIDELAKIALPKPARPVKKSIAHEIHRTFWETGSKAAIARFGKLKTSKEYYLSEDEMNNAGYGLLQGGKTAEAIELFKLNVASFPNSANAYDSLGEAYASNDDRGLAIKNYEKSIELNPENEQGLKILDELKRKASTTQLGK